MQLLKPFNAVKLKGVLAGKRTLIQQALAILRRPGIEAHVYLPGIGTLSGLAAANYLDSALTTPATVDNPVGGVVDAVGVVNATQPTTAAKPRLERGVRNLLTWSSDFSNAAWVVTGGGTGTTAIKTPNYGTAPDGTQTACRVQLNKGAGATSADLSEAYHSNLTPSATETQTRAIWAKSLSGTPNVIITGGNGVVVTNEWQLLTRTTVGAERVRIMLRGTFGTSDAADLLIWTSGLFVGTLTAAQILAEGGIPLTTTAAASNPSAGKYSWAFDGGDSLALGSVPFQMSDDHAVIAGFTCSNDAAARVVTSVYGAATTAFAAQIYQLTNTVIVEWRDDASATCSPAAQTVPLGTTVVISGRRVGNTSTSRKNGGSALTATATLGASTLNTAAIGANRFGNNMQGNTGPIIDIKGTLTDSELLTLERVVASLTPNAPSF